MTMLPPAPSPCASCPYRRDVPSGIWDTDEYAKLPRYDQPTGEQPPGAFRCHLYPDDRPRACAGWAGCHDSDELLALRVGVLTGSMTVETAEAIRDYVSPVPLFASGTEAAVHGMREVCRPSADAHAAMAKISRVRMRGGAR